MKRLRTAVLKDSQPSNRPSQNIIIKFVYPQYLQNCYIKQPSLALMYFLPNQYFHCWQKKYKLSGFARCFCDLHSKLKVLVQMDYIFENAYQCRISFKNSGGLYFQASFAPTSASFGKKKKTRTGKKIHFSSFCQMSGRSLSVNSLFLSFT